METIILDLLTRSMAEFAKINADLAATSRNLNATCGTADAIIAVAKRKPPRLSFTPGKD
jgi:hypothetical protein